ncbi:MAG: ATP-dependent DNA helicase RecG, partial [Bacilli bacterium]
TVAGIGPQKKEDLRAFGIETVRDLLEYFPFRYEDVSIKDITQMKDGEKVTIKGVVYSEPSVQWLPRKKSKLSVKVMVEPLLITATWFNRHFLEEQLLPGKEVILTGKWEQRRLQMTVSHSEFADQRNQGEGTLQPVYSVGGPLTVYHLKKMIKQALIQYGNVIEDTLPRNLLDKYRLVTRKKAINQLHFPSNDKDLKQARRRMAYEELFLFQLKLHAFRQQSRTREKGISHTFSIDKLQQFLHSLPFTLTKAQLKVLEEIKNDMGSPYSMNRLLQGDVGSGKTVIAAISIYAAYLSGFQSALMVPTEILAQQHTVELNRLLRATDLNIGTITGSTSEKERKSIHAGLEDGSVNVIVGTHALIQERVIFYNVGLVITDEQHRFGVSQRATLRLKGMLPDVLLMTATPIPRTLAITAYGDMDVSTIDELPAGRKAIETYWVKHN